MEETRSIVFIIIVGGESYLYEGQKLSNFKDINHLISSINCVCSITIFSILSFSTMSIII
jgi:hypothetical protein